jgi:hypothetical protein
MIENLQLDSKTKESLWVPPELKRELKKMSEKLNYSGMWRYIAMLHNNYKITQNEARKK